jgi:hypothetical protein
VPALSGLSRRQNSAPGTAGVAKNAIAPVSPGSIATGSGATVGVRTAIGAAAPNPQPGATGVNMGRQGAVVAPAPRGPVSLPTAVEGSIARNAVGAPAPGNTSAVAARINGPALGRPMAPPVSPAATAMNHAVINGTGMGRPSGTAIIGGATKSVTAVINGTSLRPKHP